MNFAMMPAMVVRWSAQNTHTSYINTKSFLNPSPDTKMKANVLFFCLLPAKMEGRGVN